MSFGIPVRNGLGLGLLASTSLSTVNGAALPFSPLSLFASGEPGGWYDPSDLTTLFQDSAGTLPVTAVEQPVGLCLDKSRNAVGANGAKKINVLSWTEDLSQTAWKRVNAAVLSATTVADDSTNGFHFVERTSTFSVTSGLSYTFRARLEQGTQRYAGIHYIDGTARGCSIDLQTGTLGTPYGGATATATADGSGWILTITATAGATTSTANVAIYLSNTNALASYIGNSSTITVTKVDFRPTSEVTLAPTPYQRIDADWPSTMAGAHLTQSTSTARPVLSARVNLLTQTEAFNEAVWTKTNATITANAIAAPDGTTTADALFETTTNGAHRVQVSQTFLATSYTLSCSVKPLGGRNAIIELNGSAGGGAYAYFDPSNGNLLASGVYGSGFTLVGTPSAVSQGDGWYRLTMTAILPAGSSNVFVGVASSLSPTYAGDITKGLYIWGADLRVSNDGVNLPAYQRVGVGTPGSSTGAGSSDYTTTGFPLYLRFDGTDDFMVSPTITPGIDKAQVFAGVRKLSDTAAGIIAEFLGDPSTNNGAFSFTASPSNGTDRQAWGASLRGTVAQAARQPRTYVAPTTNNLSYQLNSAGVYLSQQIVARINGVTPSIFFDGVPTTVGNFSNAALYVGARFNNPPTTPSSLFLNGRLYPLIVRFGATLTDTQIAQTESYVSTKMGGGYVP